MNDLDSKIHAMLERVGDAAPPAPRFDSLRPGTAATSGRRLLPVAAAVALVAAGVGGVIAISGDEATPVDDAPVTVPSNSVPPSTLPSVEDEVEPVRLVSAELAADSTPLIALPGWDITYSTSRQDQPPGSFEDAVVIVGPGPLYDAPLFVGEVGTLTELFGDDLSVSIVDLGEPVEIWGTEGAMVVSETDPDTKLDGPILTIFWELDDGRVARVNSVRLPVEEAVALAERYAQAVLDGSDAGFIPAGFRQLELPTYDDHRYFEFQFTQDGREVQINGENRGVASLLGRIGSEVRTTRVVDGVEMAYRPLPDSPGRYWIDWQLGDWSFYVDANGFDSEEQFLEMLSEIRVVDDATMLATDAEIVTPTNRADVVASLLVGVPVPPGFDTESLSSVDGASGRYSEIARVSGAVACGWLDVWLDATDAGDVVATQEAAAALATSRTWPMLLELETEGGWSQAVWEYADAVDNGPGIAAGSGPVAPDRENAASGLGCDFG